jgi:hypothetical protein
MAWTYADYETQTTDTDRLLRLRLHMAEVSDQITADITAGGGKSRSSASLTTYRAMLAERLQELERRTGQGGGVRVALSDRRSSKP